MQPILLKKLRDGEDLSIQDRVKLTLQLSWPAILAQTSSIIMQYIDAAMVGRLGTNASGSIGLVATTTWLFGGMTIAVISGFNVMVAQSIGAKDEKTARNIMRQSFAVALALDLLLMLIGIPLARSLPKWLGGDRALWTDASDYFLVFILSLPAQQICSLANGQLQASGNMRTPSILLTAMCFLDIIFNGLFIFPAGTFHLGQLQLPGFGLGVLGAALGTAMAHLTVGLTLTYILLLKSPELHLRKGEKLVFSKEQLRVSLKISMPVIAERVIMAGAQVMATRIVAPLGAISTAANSFAITAESLCYMPGFGVQSAASILVGQSIGAKRKDLTYHLGILTVALGMGMMTVTGVLLYIVAPFMMGLLSLDTEVVLLGTEVLRVETFAEPLYAASIVAGGVFQGAGSTAVSTVLNFGSMWGVRIPLAAILAKTHGLRGVWVAMCIELCVRGTLFLICLVRKRWLPKECALR